MSAAASAVAAATASWAWTNSTSPVGFGTAALGSNCASVVTMALEEGFRVFDTAEADWWYDQAAVGRALADFFTVSMDDECIMEQEDVCGMTCESQDLRVSSKIPPWSLTSEADIRRNAAATRKELVGFCENFALVDEHNEVVGSHPYPLDVYYIHAPTCWPGWHNRCNNHPPLLALKDSWRAMEAVVDLDHSAMRIGLSNIQVHELEAIVADVKLRQGQGVPQGTAAPRIPDVVQAYADPIRPADDMRAACQRHGIEFVSYSTLGTQHSHRMKGENPVLGSPVIRELADQHQRSIAEVVLSWALAHGMHIIPRSSKREHIMELARLLDPERRLFLDDADRRRIDAMKDSV